jgi:starch synthase (maltosyl-transferring)
MNATPAAIGRIPVRDVRPSVDSGARPAKAVVGETFQVTATVFREGHDTIGANVVLYDPDGRPGPWTPMRELAPGSDRWGAEVTPDATGRWSYVVEAWGDRGCWRYPLRELVTVSEPRVLLVERERALYGAWYEFFPRSRAGEMGFDVAAMGLPAADPPDREHLPQGPEQHPVRGA